MAAGSTNKSRQPITQKAAPGAQRYQDATNNSRVGKAPRVEAVDADKYFDTDTGQIAPEASTVSPVN